jgi:hypothetical protein
MNKLATRNLHRAHQACVATRPCTSDAIGSAPRAARSRACPGDIAANERGQERPVRQPTPTEIEDKIQKALIRSAELDASPTTASSATPAVPLVRHRTTARR